ncbi:ribonuclease H-like domain-containing protein [Tanacetum coccineum]
MEKAEKERDEFKLTLEKFQNSSKSLNNLLESQVIDKFKTRLGYNAASSTAASPAVESFMNSSEMLENQENNKSKSDKGYHTVLPPFTGNFIPFKPDLTFMDEIVESENMDVITIVTPSNVKTVESNLESAGVKSNSDAVEPKTIRMNSFRPPVIEDCNSDDDSEVELIPNVENKSVRPSTEKIKFAKSARVPPKQNKHYPKGNQRNWNNLMSQRLGSNFKMINKACFICGSFEHRYYVCDKKVIRPMWNNTSRVNHKKFTNKMTHPHPNRRFVPQTVLTKSGKINTAGASVNTVVRPANTAGSKPTGNPQQKEYKEKGVIDSGNQTNGIAGTRDNIVTGQAEKKTESEQEYIIIPICTIDPLISQDPKVSEEDAEKKPVGFQNTASTLLVLPVRVSTDSREDEFHDDNTPPTPPPVTPTQPASHTLSTIKLPILKKGVSTKDANQKFLRVFESDIKGYTTSSSSTQNVAFVSSKSTNSTNDVSTAYSVSTSFGHNSQKEGSSSYTDELKYSFFANQSSGLQLDHKDLEQVDEFDLEEMDLKWHVAMISIRLKKFYKKTGRRLQFDAKEPVGFNKTKVECFNCHNTGHFARECISKGNQESRRRDAGNTGYKAKDNGRRLGKQEEPKALVTLIGEGVDWTGHAEDKQENFSFMAYSNSGSDTEVTSCSKECVESYAKLKKLYDEQREQLGDASIEIQAYTQALKKKNDRFAKVKGMHAVPPLMTGNYMPPKSDFGIDESQFTYGLKQSKTSESDE